MRGCGSASKDQEGMLEGCKLVSEDCQVAWRDQMGAQRGRELLPHPPKQAGGLLKRTRLIVTLRTVHVQLILSHCTLTRLRI